MELFESLTGICPHCLFQSIIVVKDHASQVLYSCTNYISQVLERNTL